MRKWWSKIAWVVPLLAGGAFGVFLASSGWVDRIAEVSPWFLIHFLVAFPLVILLHELGHFLAGKLVALRFHALMLFKWGLVVQNHQLKWRSFPRLFGGGMTMMTPPDDLEPSRGQYVIYFFGGVAINFISALLAAYLLTQGGLEHGLARGFTVAILVWSVLLGVLNLIPFHAQGMMTDGARILSLLTSKEEGLLNSKVMSLFGLMISGPRPSRWPPGLLPDKQLPLPFLLDCSRHIANYCYEYDSGQLDQAQASVAALEQLLGDEKTDTSLLGDYHKELALHHLLVTGNRERAQNHLAQAKPSALSSPHYDHLINAAEAGLAGDWPRYQSELATAREKSDKSILPFLASVQVDWVADRFAMAGPEPS